MGEDEGSKGSDRTTTVGFLLVPGFPLMTYAAAVEPLRAANQLAGQPLYAWWHAAPGDRPVQASNGVTILPDVKIGESTAVATCVFVCAGGNPSSFKDGNVFNWLRRLARHGTAVGGISGGPYVLARAGLLDERRCTVHWEHLSAFQESFPRAQVERSLFEFDGDRITCSGGMAAFDMMLHVIMRDHGGELAGEVSDWFLHHQMREGVSPQRAAAPLRFAVRDVRLLRVLQTMEDNLETPLSRDTLAASACLSARQLERLFQRNLGRGPHRYYLELRLRQARRLTRESPLNATQIARATGFDSAAEMRRAQKRMAARDIGREVSA